MEKKISEAPSAEEESVDLRTSRRGFLKGMGVAAGATMLFSGSAQAQDTKPARPSTPGLQEVGRKPVEITLNVNGKNHKLKVEPRTTLLDALREKLDITGAKEICDRGYCSGCTVLIDGRAVTSCMALAIDAEGHKIMTAEGISKDPKYKNLMKAFHDHDAAQCGYCIPGFLVRSAALLEEMPNATPAQIRQGLEGNLCRCGTYSKIFTAVEAAASKGGVG